MDPVGSRPAEFAEFIKTDMERWAKLTKELNINPE